MSDSKVAFFFGAGAEGTGNYGISTGLEYMKASLFGYGLGEYTSNLSNFFSSKYYNDQFKYNKWTLTPSDKMIKNMIIERIRHSPLQVKGLECDMAQFLNKEDIEEIRNEDGLMIDSYKLIKDIEAIEKGEKTTPIGHMSEQNSIKTEFEEIMKENKDYDSVKSDILRALFSKNTKDGKCDTDMQIGMGGYLDSYFHTIINPYKYGRIRFSKVFNYYWACYFTILKDILALFPDIQSMVCDEKDSSKIDWGKVLNNLPELSGKLYGETIPDRESYYKAIAEHMDRNGECIAGVLTTNYFHFAEKVLKINQEKVAYLNGQMKWMEQPEKLEVIDISANQSIDGLFFPFIFGQSMTKPIVHHYQIGEFQKAKSILDKAKYLVVIGYGINEDDNHINSLLHCFAAGKKIIVLNRNDDIKDHDIIADTARKLRCEKNSILCCNISKEKMNNQKCVEKIFGLLSSISN